MPPRTDIERDSGRRRLVLSMRLKVSISLLALFLIAGSLVSMDIPNAMEAVRGLGRDTTLTENESQQSEREAQEEAQEGAPQGIDWPNIGGSPSRTGCSPSSAPHTNNTAWTYQIDGWVGSLVVSGGILFVVAKPTHQLRQICAFDQYSGELLWTKDVASYGSSCAVGDGIVFVAGDDSLYAYNHSTGEMVWNRSYDRVTYCPVISDGLLLTGGDRICAYDLTGELVWIYHTPPNEEVPYFGSKTATPAVDDGVVFAFNPFSGSLYAPWFEGNHVKGSVFALDRSTGERLWTYQTGWTRIGSSLDGGGYPVVADGMVIVNADSGLYALKRTTGELVWRTFLEPYWSREPYGAGMDVAHMVNLIFETPPAVADGTIFALAQNARANLDDSLNCVAMNLSTGELIWETEVSGMPEYMYTGPGVGSPVVADGLVFIGTYGNGFFALDQSTGEVKWRYETQALGYISPAVASGMVFVAAQDDMLYTNGMLYAFADVSETTRLSILSILSLILLPALLRRSW